MFEIVFRQTLTMFFYMLCGFVLFRCGKISKEGSKSLANILIFFIFPTVVIKSFRIEYSQKVLTDFLLGLFLCLSGILIAIAVSRVVFRNRPIESFAVSFSNAGFFGVPLVIATLGNNAVIYSIGSAFLVGSLQHTYGVRLLTGKKETFTFKTFLLAPNCVGMIIGFVLFITGLFKKLPPLVNDIADGIAALNAPVVMLILGSYLAQSDLKKMFTDFRLYFVSFVRLVLIPFITVIIFRFIPVSSQIKMAVVMCLSTCCGTNVAVYCQLNNKDYPYACQVVALSTLFCIVTLPLVCMLADKLFV